MIIYRNPESIRFKNRYLLNGNFDVKGLLIQYFAQIILKQNINRFRLHLYHRFAHNMKYSGNLIVHREKLDFHLFCQVLRFLRQLLLPPYRVNLPLLLRAPHIYNSTCVSPADIHRSASGALVMLQTYVASTGCHLSIKTTAARHRIF